MLSEAYDLLFSGVRIMHVFTVLRKVLFVIFCHMDSNTIEKNNHSNFELLTCITIF